MQPAMARSTAAPGWTEMRSVYMSRTRPPGWTLGAPKKPGRYWYAESRGTAACLVTVAWQEAKGSPDGSVLVFYADEGGPMRLTSHSTGWWRILAGTTE